MQRYLLILLVATLPLSVFAEEAPQKDLLKDTQECTIEANAQAQVTDGDAAAGFLRCMKARGYTQSELDDLEEQ